MSEPVYIQLEILKQLKRIGDLLEARLDDYAEHRYRKIKRDG